MKRRLAKLALLFTLLVPAACVADSVDRIVATVNHQPILASDVDDEAHFEALQQVKAPIALDEDRRGVLSRVIQRELICQQMPATFEPTKEAVDAQIKDLRAQFSIVKSDAQWSDLLASYDFSEQGIRDFITLQLKVVHFLDLRLRPTVRVDREEVGEYYSAKLVPQLKAAGAAIDSIDKVRSQIEEVLLQQKMSEVFNAWVANLRSQGSIQILDPDLAPPATPVSDTTVSSNR
jgi:peptidyl-prolyl cis-trans isomerase SurA